MPYCTIEEAWSQSLNPELNNDLNKDISSDLGYQNINLKDQELHNSEGKPIRKKKKKRDRKNRVPNMSRTYNRLPEHNGPKTRLKNTEKIYVRDGDQNSLSNNSDHPTYSNSDLPINSYNNSMYEELDDEYNKNSSNIDNSSMMEDFKNIVPTNNDELSLLKSENKRLKNIIESLKNNRVEDKDTLVDLVVYLSTGVIIILMLENITKLIRKF